MKLLRLADGKYLIFFFFLMLGRGAVYGQSTEEKTPPSGIVMQRIIENGDTIFVGQLRNIYCYPPLLFKNKKQEKFYWRTVRDVKKALPYARLVSNELTMLNHKLIELPDDKARKKFMKRYEKEMFRTHANGLRDLTINQGKMLVKLIDREYGISTYDLIASYKGNFPAFFWHSIATIFGSSLKTEYSDSDKDKIIERVINLVDAGQL